MGGATPLPPNPPPETGFAGLLLATLVFGVALFTACAADAPAPRSPPSSAVQAGAPTSPPAAAFASEARGAANHPPAAVRRPPEDCNVVLISIDSLRADMPWTGYPRPIAPRLTQLEASAVSYTQAYAVSSYTSTSLGGLLAGRLPSELNRSGYFFGMYKNNVFFPQTLRRAGIRTMGVMAHTYFGNAGFDAGFDVWKLVPGLTWDPNTDRDITSPQSERIAEEVLGDAANDSGRFFFWVHFMDPHDQYMRHPGIDWGKRTRDYYDGEVTFTDEYVGRLVDFIHGRPWAARTVIIVTSDHGEEFGEHMMRHAFEVWQALVHVPLFVVAPGAAPRRIHAARSAIDIAPTIVDLFGVDSDAPMSGKSLVNEIYGGPTEERDVIVDLPMTSDSGRRRALIHGTDKLICFDDDTFCRLFDLAKDPLEKSPIMNGSAYKAMRARYDAAAKSIQEVTPYACTAECLNSGYRKQQSVPSGPPGAPDAGQRQ